MLAPWLVWAVVRTFGLEGDLQQRLVPAMAFTPYVALTSLIPLVVAIALRRWWVVAAALVVGVALGAAVLPRAFAGPRPAVSGGVALRVLTLNAHAGAASPRALLGLVAEQRPDVLLVQELTPGQLAALDAGGLGRALPHRVADARGGSDGAGVFSRWPLRRAPDPGAVGSRVMPRVLLQPPGTPAIDLQLVHLPSPQGPTALWERMLGALGRRSAGSDALEVLAGDFNATLDHAALRGLLHRLDVVDAADAAGAGLDMTWPADRSYPALIAIDHVLVDRRAAAREARAFDVAGSDHRALLAVLTVPRA